MARVTWMWAVVVVMAVSGAGAKTVFVSTAGDDGNDGLTWSAAKATVQAGLAAAQAGDQVWVAAGRYVENITLKDGVVLYGGFTGNENPGTFDPVNRNIEANETIMDGNKAGSVVTSPTGATAETGIDGFTITNGSASFGGGIYCADSSLTIINNTVKGNAVSGKISYGGGIYCGGSSSPLIAYNRILGNRSSNGGGGIYCSSSSPTIMGNVISDNVGSGIYCANATATIIGNTITANNAVRGGGICCYESSCSIVNTIIAFNTSGIYRYNDSRSVTLRHCCVYENTAGNYIGLEDPTGTDGNISVDPLLANLVYDGNVHILPDSPCRDAGDDGVVQVDWFDIDGQVRIQGGTVDIGADESNGTAWTTGPYVIVRVSPDGDDAHDGSTWLNAKRTVQAGIDAAATVGGDVWVAAGLYQELISMHQYVHVYGGFASIEDTRNQRDWTANETVLDGQQAGSVVMAANIGNGLATVDGFTITNGIGTEAGPDRYGGGIHCSYASPTIANNKITGNNNQTLVNYLHGGGIYCESSSPTIIDNVITDNTAYHGAGIYCTSSCSMISGNVISGNNVIRDGGGLFCSRSPVRIVNNQIADNKASSSYSHGGGIYCYGSSTSPIIVDNTITGNYSREGGGISCKYSPAAVDNNSIIGNAAGLGGGVACTKSSTVFTGNRINANMASGAGGGVYCYGASPTFFSNTISDNSAANNGGALYCVFESSPVITNSTLSGNSALSGGGIYCSDSSCTLTNSIVAFNSSGLQSYNSGIFTVRYSCIFSNASFNFMDVEDVTGTDGNISVDPKLANLKYGNTHLQPDSPCREAGDDSVVQADWLDVDGQARIHGGSVDIGADESDGTTWATGPLVIVRVSPDGDDAHDGSTWQDAKQTVQAGIEAAAAVGGDVWVAAGTFQELITLLPYAYVYGGFDGTETTCDQRDWTANETILDGHQVGSVVTAKRVGYGRSAIDGFMIEPLAKPRGK